MGVHLQTVTRSCTMFQFVVIIALVSLSVAQDVGTCVKNSALQVHTLKTSPYPPTLSNGFSVSYDVELVSAIDGDIDVSVTLKKKMGFVWVKIPCIDDSYGSCKYLLYLSGFTTWSLIFIYAQ